MNINAVVLKIASRCNLNCSYCYMYHHADQGYLRQPKIMKNDVFQATMETMLSHSERQGEGHRMALIMHGGEPTLVGTQRFRWFVETARKILGNRLMLVAIQTNALLITQEWADLFLELDIQVSVSLDGTPEVNDANRIDHSGHGSHQRTVVGIHELQSRGVEPRIICVVNPSASGKQTYQHFRQLGINQMDFLFPDTTHDTKSMWYGDSAGTPIAKFLIDAFDAWMAEDNPSVSIRVFYNLLRSFMGAPPGSDAFGNPLLNYLIVNTDGAIEGSDALRVCHEGLVATDLNVVSNQFEEIKQTNSLLYQVMNQGLPLSDTCLACPEVKVCGGGHFPHRYSESNGFHNPSAWCEDIQVLFRHIRKRMGLYYTPPASSRSPNHARVPTA